MKQILVIGLGQTGQSILRYFKRRQRDGQLVAYDTRTDFSQKEELKRAYPNSQFYFGELPEEIFSNIDIVVKSPGIEPTLPVLKKFKAKGIAIIGDIELALKEIKKPIIAISGTNGKSTVTAWVGHALTVCGYQPAVVGNIGTPILDCIDDKQYTHFVIECSSFQLDDTPSMHSDVACLLNIDDDHLDRYGSLSAYQASKQQLFKHTKQAIYNGDDEHTKPRIPCLNEAAFSLAEKEAKSPWHMSLSDSSYHLAFKNQALLSVKKLGVYGRHNWANALAVLAILSALGIEKVKAAASLINFKGLPHRCELIAKHQGVAFINDSKGTNVGATLSAVESFANTSSGKLILILGGLTKNADFKVLYPVIEKNVAALILIGQDSAIIAQALSGACDYFHASTLAEAVLQAYQKASPEGIVLFSPACASYDMFKNYAHRGQCFREVVGGMI